MAPMLQIFHPNLTVLLLNIAASLFVALVSRTVMLFMGAGVKVQIRTAVYYWADKISDLGKQ